MIHEHANVTGTITISLEAEDWVWLCRMLSALLKSPEMDTYAKEDTQHLLNILEDATR